MKNLHPSSSKVDLFPTQLKGNPTSKSGCKALTVFSQASRLASRRPYVCLCLLADCTKYFPFLSWLSKQTPSVGLIEGNPGPLRANGKAAVCVRGARRFCHPYPGTRALLCSSSLSIHRIKLGPGFLQTDLEFIFYSRNPGSCQRRLPSLDPGLWW